MTGILYNNGVLLCKLNLTVNYNIICQLQSQHLKKILEEVSKSPHKHWTVYFFLLQPHLLFSLGAEHDYYTLIVFYIHVQSLHGSVNTMFFYVC